jgi:hypothetical protein
VKSQAKEGRSGLSKRGTAPLGEHPIETAIKDDRTTS